jgi:hypothetical protein
MLVRERWPRQLLNAHGRTGLSAPSSSSRVPARHGKGIFVMAEKTVGGKDVRAQLVERFATLATS